MFDRARLLASLESDLPEALRLLEAMVAINSFTTNAAGVNRLGTLTAQAFAPLGFSAERFASTHPDYGQHLVLRRGETIAPSLALISHLDTVFPPEEEERNDFHWRPEGDRIYGPGTHDIKGGTIMMWLVLRTLARVCPQSFEAISWQLFFNSSEETLSPDFGALCRRHFTPRTQAALVFESEGRLGDERLLVVARKGRGTWQVRVRGRGAHAGTRHAQGANAAVQLALTVQQIAALTDYSRELTVNPALLQAGGVLNRVPHEAEAAGEFRAFSQEVFAKARRALLALNGPGTIASPADRYACTVEVKITGETRPWPRNPETDRLAALFERAGRELGLPVGIEQRGGLSDGNLIWDAVPTLDGLGPWGENDHCSERTADGSKVPEYIHVPSILPKALLNTVAILRLIDTASAPH